MSICSLAVAQTQGVGTRIGKTSFENGYPSKESVGKLYDELDFQRACLAYLWGLPIVSLAEWQQVTEKTFGAGNADIVVYRTYRDKLNQNPLARTAATIR